MTSVTHHGRTVRLVPKDATPPPTHAGHWSADRWASTVAQMRTDGESRTMRAVRAVLVDGLTPQAAADAHQVSRQAVRTATHRVQQVGQDRCPTCGQHWPPARGS